MSRERSPHNRAHLNLIRAYDAETGVELGAAVLILRAEDGSYLMQEDGLSEMGGL